MLSDSLIPKKSRDNHQIPQASCPACTSKWHSLPHSALQPEVVAAASSVALKSHCSQHRALSLRTQHARHVLFINMVSIIIPDKKQAYKQRYNKASQDNAE